MRVMLDTNVLVSAILFPGGRMEQMIELISSQYELVLASYVIDELKDVTAEKFPDKIRAVDRLLTKMGYDLVYTPDDLPDEQFEIRDPKDYPILYTAEVEAVDILITGDTDFSDIETKQVEICTPAEFMERYGA